MLSTFALVLSLAAADYRTQFPLPALTVPSGWGINIHFTNPEPGEVERIRDAGFRWIRIDLMWSRVERRRGEYDFSDYDQLIRSLDANRIRPLFILDYGNDLYEKGAPKSAEARAAFARFVEAAVRHYRHRGVLWEMWNEPNLAQFWQPHPNVDQYIALAKEVGRTLRAVAPDEWYLGPATSGFDWNFLTRCLDAGLLEYWDAVSVHPYRSSEPESVAADWGRLRSLIRSHAPKGKTIPMISGEWGYSDINTNGPEKQGHWVVRQYLSNLAAGVPISILYDWRDDGADPKDPEHHFGAVFRSMAPKPAYQAIQHLARELEGYSYRLRLALPSRQDYLYVFKKGSATKLVGYTLRPGPITASLPVGDASFRVTSPTIQKVLEKGSARKGVTLTAEPRVFTPTSSNDAIKALAEWEPMPESLSLDEAPEAAKSAVASASRLDLPDAGQIEVADVAEEPDRPKPPVTRARLSSLRSTLPVPSIATSDLEARPRYLRVRLTLPDGTVLAQESMMRQLRPLSLGFAPAERGIVMLLENPRGRSMDAELRISRGGVTRVKPVAIRPDAPTVEVRFPDVPAEWNGQPIDVRLTTADPSKKTLLALVGVAVTPLPRFSDSPLPTVVDDSRYEVAQEGEEKVKAEFTFMAIELEDAPSGLKQGARLTYTFPGGWKYLPIKLKGLGGKPLPGQPVSLCMYVYGNGAGDILRMRFIDSTGQTFQPDYGSIDWKGWRFVSFALDTTAPGRWGGANDGIIHYPIRIESIALIDSPGGRAGSGEVTFAGPMLVSRS